MLGPRRRRVPDRPRPPGAVLTPRAAADAPSASRAASRRLEAVVVALVVLLPFLVLGHGLLPGRVLAPADNLLTTFPWKAAVPDVAPQRPLLTDVTLLVHPMLLHGAARVQAGDFPLWNPYVFAGAPFFANPHSALLFPLTALGWLLPAPTALGLIAILKLAATGLAMYWCARTLALGVPAAAVGALALMLGGVTVVWLQWTFASTIAFLPLLVALAERLRGDGGRRWVAALALALALALVAGYPQGALNAAAVAAAWGLVHARGAAGGPARYLARLGGGMALGALLAAVQLLPFLEYAGESAVVAYRREWMPFRFLPLRAAVTALVPYFYGGPPGREFWGDWNFNEITVSVGIVPWVVLPAALAVARGYTGVAFFAGLAAVSAAVLYGLPGLGPALAALPPFSLGSSLRLAPVLAFALAALGAVGVDAVQRATPETRPRLARALVIGHGLLVATALVMATAWRDALLRPAAGVPVAVHHAAFVVLVAAAAVLALAWLRCPEHGRRWGGALVAVQLASVLPLAWTYNTSVDARWLYPTPPVLARLRAETASDAARVLLVQPNVSALYGLLAPTGHDGMTPRRLEEIAGPVGTGRTLGVIGSEPLSAAAIFTSPVLDLLGVRHLVTPPGVGAPAGAGALTYAAADGQVFRNDRALPRAFVASRARCVDDSTALRLIRSRAVEYRREVLLGGDCTAAPAASGLEATATARIVTYAPERVVVAASTPAAGYLVLTDLWYPGWEASVDGVPSTIWRANHAFRAVALAAGEHEVVFTYRPSSLRLGLAVTGVAGAVVLGLLVPLRRRSG